MSVEGEVDLDDLIKKQKIEAKVKKTKLIEKKREQRIQQQRRYELEQARRRQQRIQREKQRAQEHKRQGQIKVEKPDYHSYYAIKVSGLLSDVSVDDICVHFIQLQKLLGDRKIISIKTVLRNKDRSAVDTRVASLMDVVVVLSDKNEADSFVKTYSEKKLDGKYQLSFSFINPNNELK